LRPLPQHASLVRTNHTPPIAPLQIGSGWYGLCLLSPAAGAYYWRNAERTEEFRVKMVTSDDEMTTDIVVEGECVHLYGVAR
jgi:hypothetical protein